MALSNHDQAQIREYLLGKLGETEQQKIEERLIVEDELFDEFEISKDELIEEFCSGELNRDEHQWFELHFLASAEGRERHAFTLAINRLQHPHQDVTIFAHQQPALNLFERLRRFAKTRPWAVVKAQPWAVAAAGSAAVVVLVAAMIISRPEGQTITGPTLASNIISRGEGTQPANVKLPPNAAKLKLQLLLPKAATGTAGYEAELDDRTQTMPVKVIDFNDEAVSIEIPKDQLPPGEYSLHLFAIDTNGNKHAIPGYYPFNIEYSRS